MNTLFSAFLISACEGNRSKTHLLDSGAEWLSWCLNLPPMLTGHPGGSAPWQNWMEFLHCHSLHTRCIGVLEACTGPTGCSGVFQAATESSADFVQTTNTHAVRKIIHATASVNSRLHSVQLVRCMSLYICNNYCWLFYTAHLAPFSQQLWNTYINLHHTQLMNTWLVNP